ncbi:sigma-70 family RNA polymerase sigma factor [uncultured Oscillibacter sp.]|uniref:sigma-70 family RNA polymerase sigma factor n=1 Tax=uncultured Oscillibacter sp. TaxID=876091 RepID=UPI00262239FD|nr:FliA/WhiG family RNA polymerase sigma factor [uncultured Oscillibacter sp.]
MSEQAAAIGYTEQEIGEMDTQDLLRLYKETGDGSLKWPLVLRYEGLIKNAAMQIRGVYSSFAQIDDIINEGIITLLGAIDKFDPDKGVKFETYVSKRIRGMVIDLARKQDWIPRNVRKRAKEIDLASAELSSSLGRMPTDGEIAQHLGITQERYQKDAANIALSNVLSLDVLMDTRETSGYPMEVPSSDARSQPELVLQEREMQRALAEGIASLRENEQIVLSLYYERNLHLKEIAQVMELSEPRISQIHTRAIQKLRAYMERYLSDEPEPKPKRKRG